MAAEFDSDPLDPRLRRLLALKRHETPPPGFFDRLPAKVLHQIESARSAPESLGARLWRTLVQEPMAAASYAALGIGALLFGGSVFQVATDPTSPAVAGFEGLSPAGVPTAYPESTPFMPTPGPTLSASVDSPFRAGPNLHNRGTWAFPASLREGSTSHGVEAFPLLYQSPQPP